MIIGSEYNRYGLEALEYFQKIQLTNFILDSIKFVSILLVCATFATLKWGMEK